MFARSFCITFTVRHKWPTAEKQSIWNVIYSEAEKEFNYNVFAFSGETIALKAISSIDLLQEWVTECTRERIKISRRSDISIIILIQHFDLVNYLKPFHLLQMKISFCIFFWSFQMLIVLDEMSSHGNFGKIWIEHLKRLQKKCEKFFMTFFYCFLFHLTVFEL